MGELGQLLGERGEDEAFFDGVVRFQRGAEGRGDVEQLCEVVDFVLGRRRGDGGEGEEEGGDLRDGMAEVLVERKHAVVEAVPRVGAAHVEGC